MSERDERNIEKYIERGQSWWEMQIPKKYEKFSLGRVELIPHYKI
jgi:hypothetical protein